MTLYTIVHELETIAKTQPTIRSAAEGSVYTYLNGNPSSKYCVFFISQTTHRQDDGFDYYGFNLFFIDRLKDDLEDNRLQVQSVGKETLRNIILTFCEKHDADVSQITYHPFTEKFVDECAGVYAGVEFAIPLDYLCEENYE